MSEGLRLYNTLTRTKEPFAPIDPKNVRMYVCGPTVYDFAHIGNARPVIVFDVLFRLLRHLYGADHVTYVRNITDVDDKINARALRDFGSEIASGKLSLNEAIRKVTEKTADQYHADVKALGCLEPTYEPRATEFVEPRADGKADMITLIQRLIDRGHAYVAEGEVLFNTASMKDYGQLSKRPLDEQQAGARIAVDAHKKNPGDFVLWKLSSPEEPGWDSPWGRGRPGWHIECSAMSAAYLGEVFDIHGGGLDLIFPHHENEIAQSRCAHGTDVMANVWMHNGFVQVEGRKMSKSEGNFVTIHDLLHTEKFGGRSWPGEVLRLAMLMTHYREPIDFSVRRLEEAEAEIREWSLRLVSLLEHETYVVDSLQVRELPLPPPSRDIVEALSDDLDSSSAMKSLRESYKSLPVALATSSENPDAVKAVAQFFSDLEFLGVLNLSRAIIWSNGLHPDRSVFDSSRGELLELRTATLNGNTERVDVLVQRFRQKGWYVSEKAAGCWRISLAPDMPTGWILDQIDQRLAFIRQKSWPEADRIRDELLAQGIQLKDGKDPVTGERITTWEVKR